MRWIKEGYLEAATALTSRRPATIPITLADFNTSTVDGTDEDRILNEFKNFANEKERSELTAAAAKPLHMGLAIGGGVVTLLSIILIIANSFPGDLLTIPGLVCMTIGIVKIMKARKSQKQISERAKETLRNGIIALREVCREIREWTTDFNTHQAEQADTESYMNQIIQESVDAVVFAAANR